ncbi:MAG TPA: DUF11 domain-containing protein [Verrucomicrobiae bacterium]|jgi:uncharacterized repeat protein (TIGR01451 family)|nr:DUF11 domain-containing protein [Verrucomicrobiae bacterium]
MKVPIRLRVLFLSLLALLHCERAGAQSFGLSISNSPNPVFVGDTLTYTITVTNRIASGNVIVTNFLPPSVQFIGASNSFFAGTITNNPGQVVFGLGFSFLSGNVATLTVSVIPTNSGPLNDNVVVGTQGFNDAVTASSSNFVFTPNASLGVTITGPSVAVLANDWMTYSVSVTNTGSNTANNVVLSNTLPAGVGLIGVSPATPSFTFSNSVMVFNLGTLSVGAVDTLSFTVQPTNSGTNIFTAGAIADHATNVTASTNIIVLPFDTSQLVAVNFSGMTYNPQNGLMEQTIQLSNVGTNTLAGARVVVSGLTNQLYNAVGTNNGNPFVQYGGTLGPGQSVNLLMEYFVPTRQPITVLNSAYAAVPAPAPNLSPPAGTPFAITLVTNLPDGRLLIEFQSIPGRSYTILYADNPQMTNALAAQPVVVAPADRVQWIDDGPPGTVSAPTNVGSRFYSVLLNP